MVIFNSYVKLPEGTSKRDTFSKIMDFENVWLSTRAQRGHRVLVHVDKFIWTTTNGPITP